MPRMPVGQRLGLFIGVGKEDGGLARCTVRFTPAMLMSAFDPKRTDCPWRERSGRLAWSLLVLKRLLHSYWRERSHRASVILMRMVVCASELDVTN